MTPRTWTLASDSGYLRRVHILDVLQQHDRQVALAEFIPPTTADSKAWLKREGLPDDWPHRWVLLIQRTDDEHPWFASSKPKVHGAPFDLRTMGP